ncbi:PEP-CTERM sorting domain-containing protein [Nitrosospira sp. Is2]|uniref:PEP-CTERM sorting domain-containing protein n=1 Tax=Nitrosospira sp. Is2 TaxID=3080532 RepID=UPI002953EDF4|nr:PEP-CTERM sorting domain-containing protein [Nitrosospira sp. Is2]WON74031.1 PEP-CTERM sorting domain-containing protein [Nitrosospira sp. Is2]
MYKLANLAAACGIIVATMSTANAIPIYIAADFSGGISTVKDLGSSLGLQKTNTCSGCDAGSVSGTVLFDTSLIPGNGTGIVNVPLAAVAGASNDVVFDIVFGIRPLEFKFGDSDIVGGPSIQFRNGVFNGFFLVEDFSYNGTPFELSVQGGVWDIRGWKNHSYSDLAASGYLNVGNGGLTNQTVFDPVQQPAEIATVPEPTTVALIALGVWGLIMARRRESLRARLEVTERSHTKEEPGLPRSNSAPEKELSADREPNAS